MRRSGQTAGADIRPVGASVSFSRVLPMYNPQTHMREVTEPPGTGGDRPL